MLKGMVHAKVHRQMVGAIPDARGIVLQGITAPTVSGLVGVGDNAPPQTIIPVAEPPLRSGAERVHGGEGCHDGRVLRLEVIAIDELVGWSEPCTTGVVVLVIHTHQTVVAGNIGGAPDQAPRCVHLVTEDGLR